MENIENEYLLKGQRVLLVEDDRTNCFLMEKLLNAKGMHITCVSNGEEALNLMEKNEYDLALIDINLGPDSINGFDIMKTFKDKINSKTVTVALTAYAMEMDREKIMRSGFDAFFTKPIKFNEFIEFMIKLMQRDDQPED